MSKRLSAGLLAGLVLLTQIAAAPVDRCGREVASAAAIPVGAVGALLGSDSRPDPVVQTETPPTVYAAADLIVTDAAELKVGSSSQKNAQPMTKEQQLIDLITRTVAPQTWSKNGGSGLIDYHPLTMSLVINQTPEVHQQVQKLLANLRRLQDTMISVEMRFVTVSEEHFQKLGLTKDEAGSEGAPGVKMLDDSQVHLLLQGVQSDPSANVLQAPKLTCINGQKATVDLRNKQSFITSVDVVTTEQGKKGFKPRTTEMATGFTMAVQPALSGDGISMNLAVSLIRVDAKKSTTPVNVVQMQNTAPPTQLAPRTSVMQMSTTLKIPQGKTALLTGWKHQREAHNGSPPTLAKMPYIGQLFRTITTTRQKDHLLVLVTPRVIQEKAEEKTAESTLSTIADHAVTSSTETKPQQKIVTNRKTFALGYTVENVGPSKVQAIDVWFTHDGQPWQRYPEQVSPTGSVPVKVRHEGLYGLMLVAKSGVGLSRPAPSEDEEPHIWVEVDTTPPEVVFTAIVEPENSRYPGQICLNWNASDKNLTEKPITLEWSAGPDGPWTRIGEGPLENCGEYHWEPADELPVKVYLRLSVSDKAGNIGRATSDPIFIDNKVPQVRDVRFQAR